MSKTLCKHCELSRSCKKNYEYCSLWDNYHLIIRALVNDLGPELFLEVTRSVFDEIPSLRSKKLKLE